MTPFLGLLASSKPIHYQCGERNYWICIDYAAMMRRENYMVMALRAHKMPSYHQPFLFPIGLVSIDRNYS